jgi:hypothetical protein
MPAARGAAARALFGPVATLLAAEGRNDVRGLARRLFSLITSLLQLLLFDAFDNDFAKR